MVRLAAALLLTLALAAPARAQEPADLTRGPVRVVEAAGSNANAACRRAGACPSREEAVAAYARTTTHRALAFQYALGNAVPMVDAPWVGTHNSANSASEDPTLSGSDHNQQLSLRDQLRLDVRSLELDVHWVAGRAVVCHGLDAGRGHGGCTTERTLDERLAEIAAWLRDNPREVLLLYFEDHLYPAGGGDGTVPHEAAAAVIEKHLGRFVHAPGGCTRSRLPMTLTRDDVLEAGRQVVLVARGCGAGSSWPALVHDWSEHRHGGHVEARPVDFGGFPDCGPNFDRTAYETRMVRYFEDSTVVSATGWPTGATSLDDGLTPATTAEMVRCGVDLFGFDQLLPDDRRLDALVWSWDPVPGACASSGEGGYWEADACHARRPYACRDAHGSWRVTGPPGPHGAGDAACRRAGARFAVPRTGHDNALAAAAAQAAAARPWLGYRPSRGR